MSKKILNKYLANMTNDHMESFILDMYSNSKSVAEYVDHLLNPDKGSEGLIKYKKVIEKEFYPKNPLKASLKYSVAKKAIKDFASLKPEPIYLAELMLYLPELASKYSYEFGDISEQYYISAENNFDLALSYIAKNGLLTHFKEQSKKCLQYASECGYGFDDSMNDIYDTYYIDKQD